MITTILLIWILIEMQAPIWCYILVGAKFLLNISDYILKLIEGRLKKLNDELERNQKLEELSGR